jgi:glyoxylase-like metal-dependent hydrolase (beta-lactamase superfamily II)
MMSYLLKDPSGFPWVVLTGDTLFAREVGRVDLRGMDKAQRWQASSTIAIFDIGGTVP